MVEETQHYRVIETITNRTTPGWFAEGRAWYVQKKKKQVEVGHWTCPLCKLE